MKNDLSYGILPLKKIKSQWHLLLIQHHSGYWGFPKGHQDPHETPQQTALRELFEETGLQVKHFLFEEVLSETYFFTFHGEKIHKTVHYFIAEVKGKLVIQDKELLDARWVALEEAESQVTYPNGKAICRKLKALIFPAKQEQI